MTFLSKKSAFAYSALALSIMTVEAQAADIQGLSVKPLSENTTQISIGFDGTPVTPVAYQQAGSNQLMLDFNQVGSNGLPRVMPINRGVINEITALNNGTTTRLMVALNKAANYSSSIEGNQLLINIIESANVPTRAVQPSTSAPMSVNVNPLLVPNRGASVSNYEGISTVDYAGNNNGGGDITINLTNESLPIDVQRQGNKLVVRTTGTTIPRHLLRRIQAGGLVDSIDTKNQGTNGVITINMSGDYEYQAYQSGSSLHISVLPPKLLRQPTIEEKVYTGEPLSMEFQDVSVRTVLDVLGQFTETNIVASDSVAGNITLRLMNVPWDQALDIILKSKNLGQRKNGNVILVAPAQELADQEAKELEAQQKVESFLPLRTEYIRLNYAKAEDVMNLITEAKNSSNGNSNVSQDAASLLSGRGSVSIDQRTNTLIVRDTSESINNIRALVDKIDIAVKQVMIEARIVTANESFSKDLGIQWGAGQSTLKPFSSDSTNLSVNLGSNTNNTSSISLGLLSISDLLLNLNLSAMQAEGSGEVISSPKVLTADKQTAKISSGKQIPYQEASASGATSVSFKDAVLSLEVTPNITPEGKIALNLEVKNADTTGEVYLGVPVIREDSISTNIVLEDGQTVVLGGVFRNTVQDGQGKVPFLGDLPGVGRLFRSNNKTNEKAELLIFITPKIVNDGVSYIN